MSKSKFKVGDKVKYIGHLDVDDRYFFKIGNVYEISNIDTRSNVFFLDDLDSYVDEDQIEKVIDDEYPKGMDCHIMVTDGLKHDNGKTDFSLVPVEIYHAIADVMTFGASKYSADSWKQVESKRYFSAALRHLFAWKNGETHDPESGRHHLAHVLTNVAFMLWKCVRGER